MRWLPIVLVAGLLLSAAPSAVVSQESPPAEAPADGIVLPAGAPSSPAEPPAAQTADASSEAAAPSADAPTESWVATHSATELWSDPDGGVSFGPLRRGSYLQLTGTAADGRLYVLNPRTGGHAWVDASAVGPVPAPSAEELAGPQVVEAINKPGRTIGGYNLRTWPAEGAETLIRPLQHNQPITVYESVIGEDGEVWYRVGDGEYIHNGGVRLPRTPPRTFPGRWIDADLREPAMLTAYEGDQIVYTTLTIKGSAISPTPTGTFRIIRRVANEIMDSATLGIPRNSPRGYYLRNVLYTQYFHGSGAAIHYNYWRGEWGYPGSNGCLGLTLEDSLWFWNWASIGTVVNIHG